MEPRPDMNIKVAAFTVSEILLLHPQLTAGDTLTIQKMSERQRIHVHIYAERSGSVGGALDWGSNIAASILKDKVKR